MSITLIVVISALMASLIGLKVYLENKEEEQTKANNEDQFSDLQTLIINPVESTVTIEQPTIVESTPEAETANVVAEPKPKKKKRYYGKRRKPQAKVKKANNNNN